MAHGHGSEEKTGRSYVGLISLLVVIAALILALVFTGTGPLDKGSHGEEGAAEHGDAGPAADGAAHPATAAAHEEAAAHEAEDEHAETAIGAQGDADEQADAPEAQEAAPVDEAAAPEMQDTNAAPALGPDTVLTRIAFGSCLEETGPMDILSSLAARQPQALIMMGDNVYADVRMADGTRTTSPLLIRAAYAKLGARPEFQALRNSMPILAVWDDHDYGLNDAGAEFEFKKASKEAFFDFFKLARTTERYTRESGVYDSVIVGPEGQRVQIILLDTRSMRSPLLPSDAPGTPGKEVYIPDDENEKTMLGEEQWAWLEQQLIEPADVRILVSSIQVIADGHGYEAWRTLPPERTRLYQLLRDTEANNVVILSGDRHAAGIYKNEEVLDYPLYEATSSSLNLPLSAWVQDPSPEIDPYRLDAMYRDANFGMLEIDWEARALNLEIRGQDGALVQGVSVPFPGTATE